MSQYDLTVKKQILQKTLDAWQRKDKR